MDNDIENILKEQARVLPHKVRQLIVSTDWEKAIDAVAERLELSPENAGSLRMETMFVLAGLTYIGEFRVALASQLKGIDQVIIDSIAAEIEEKIFAPIRTDLVEFFEEQEEIEKEKSEQSSSQTPAKTWEKMPDVAPDNLPVGEPASAQGYGEAKEGEPPIPTLIPKTRPGEDEPGGETHPFEEKMKKVFTGAGATIGDLALETPAPEKDTPIANDPYREPVE